MGSEAVDEYQQLGEQLDEAAQVLKKTRKKRSAGGAGVVTVAGANGETIAASAEALATGAAQEALEAEVSETADAGEATPDGEVHDTAPGKNLVDLPTLEALLFSTRHPLTSGRIGELMDVPSSKALRAAIAELNRQYEESGRCFRVEQVAGGYQLLTLPVYGPLLLKLHQREIDSKLSRSALETLAIIAYKQPVLRAEVEAIRGVASGETIRSLMEKHLVKIAGRAEEPGRPILYGTTKRFLEIFGLNSTKELPKDDQARPARPPQPVAVTPAPVSEPVAVEESATAQAEAPSDAREETTAKATENTSEPQV